jgi:hypothetical protein
MQRIEVERRPVDIERFRGSYASERHAQKFIDGPALVFIDGCEQPAAVYVELDERLPEAVAALRRINFSTSMRMGGMISTSRTFGYAPKMVGRGEETCREAKLATEDRHSHDVIAGLSAIVEGCYRRLNPHLYAEHQATVSNVLPDWRLSGGVFTSGIINRNNKLPYHYDRGNFADCWSNMLVFKRGCAGGNLACPELDLCFRLRDHSLLMFDGQSILHGVTPFRMARQDGYRFSVVFYSLKQMWRCETQSDTVSLAARRRTAREQKRFA